MARQLACPSCPHVLTVPDSLLGQSVRCPECGVTFQTTSEGAVIKPDVPTFAPLTSQTPAPVPPPPATKPCPACHEMIPEETLRCPFCAEDATAPASRYEGVPDSYIRRDVVPHRGNIILLLGILSLVAIGLGVCCPPLTAFGVGLGAAAWIMGNADLRRMVNGDMDPAGEGSTNAGRICGIIGVILNGLYLLAWGAYFLVVVVMMLLELQKQA